LRSSVISSKSLKVLKLDIEATPELVIE